ncbi:MAG: FecR family protein [Verrucomicrobiota bacterium]|nr:FecR family protein [Verrucomicrobiota bacterium]
MNLIEDNTVTQMPIERNMPGFKHKPYRSNGPSNLFKPGIKRESKPQGLHLFLVHTWKHKMQFKIKERADQLQGPADAGDSPGLELDRMPLSHWPCLFILAGTVLAGCDMAIPPLVRATSLEVSGTVHVTAVESDATKRNLQAHAPLRAGDTIETGENSRLAFLLLPGALIQLEPRSKLLIEEITLRKNGFAPAEAMQRSIRVRLWQGVLFAILQWETDPPASVVATVHGTLSTGALGLCRIETAEARTRVLSARGTFTFNVVGHREPIHIPPGYAQEWPSPGFAPFPAELDHRTLPQMYEARDVEQKLLRLQRRRQFAPYPWRLL